MRENGTQTGAWDLSALNEDRVRAFIRASEQHLKRDSGNYLTLNRITVDRSEKQLARYTDRRQAVEEWLRHELRGLRSEEPMLKLRLRQWAKGGQGRSGVVFLIKRQHSNRPPPTRTSAPTSSLGEARSVLAQAAGRQVQAHNGALQQAEQRSQQALAAAEAATHQAKRSAQEANVLRERVEELEAELAHLHNGLEALARRVESQGELHEQTSDAITQLTRLVCG